MHRLSQNNSECRRQSRNEKASRKVLTLQSQTSESPLLSNYLSILNISGAKQIDMPLQSLNDCSPIVFLPSGEVSMPHPPNVRYLNNFLKKQTFIIRHKQKWLIKSQKKGVKSEKVAELQQKIMKMMNLQNESEINLRNIKLKEEKSASVINITSEFEPPSEERASKMRKDTHLKHNLSLNKHNPTLLHNRDLPRIIQSIKHLKNSTDQISETPKKEQKSKTISSNDLKKDYLAGKHYQNQTKKNLTKIDLQLKLSRKAPRGKSSNKC